MRAALVFLAAAAAEIGGCWLVYAVLRLGLHPLALGPAAVLLGAFAWLLTLHDLGGAGRAFAVYGGVYVAASLVWLAQIEGVPLTRADLVGGAVVLTGAAIIWAGARGF